MADRITLDAHDHAGVGTTIASLEPVPGVGTWQVVDHEGCEGNGRLKALTPGEPAPLCADCDREVTWRLSLPAPSVAPDHGGAGRRALTIRRGHAPCATPRG